MTLQKPVWRDMADRELVRCGHLICIHLKRAKVVMERHGMGS